MKRLKKEFSRLASISNGKKGRVVIFVIAIALFVISAGAPNASIGIGK